MVATEVFGDEYDEDAREEQQRIRVSDEQPTDIVPIGRGFNAHMVHIDDVGFIPGDVAPEMLTTEQQREKLVENGQVGSVPTTD